MKTLLLFVLAAPAWATSCVAVGSFVAPTGVAPQTLNVTTADSRPACGGNFQPKAIIFFGSDQTGDGAVAGLHRTIGFGSASVRETIWQGASDGVSGVVACCSLAAEHGTYSYWREVENGPSPTVKYGASVSAVSASGFTFDALSINDAVQPIVNYIAFGGSDITGAVTGLTGPPASNGGSVTVSSLGLTPSIVFFYAQALGTESGGGTQSFSACTISKCVSSAYQAKGTAGGTTQARSFQRSNLGFVEISGAGSFFSGGTITAMDSGNGGEFTMVSPTSGGTNNNTLTYMAIAGGAWTLGAFSQPAATGNQAVPIAGMNAMGVVVASANNTANAGTTLSTTGRHSIGATDGTNQFAMWVGFTNGVSTTVAKEDLDRTKLIKLETESAGGPTVNASAGISSFSGGGMVLNWGTADATARETVFIAYGALVVPPPFAMLANFPLGIN